MPSSNRAFSLLEMLVVTAIIGVLSAVGVGALGKVHDASAAAATNRNVQNLTSAYNAALAAGHNFAEGKVSVPDVLDAIVIGADVKTGNKGLTFIGIPGLTPSERDRASAYFKLEADNLRYTP